MTIVEKVMLLKGVELFAEIPSDELAAIARIAQVAKVPAGDLVMVEGDHGDALFFVVAGRARIFTAERTLNEVGERAVIGELALLDPGPRAASVEAMTDLVLLRINRDEFVEILAVHAEVTLAVIKLLARRVREAI